MSDAAGTSRAIQWAREALTVHGYRLLHVERELRGRQADVSIIAVVHRRTGTRRRVVMKRLRRDYKHNSPTSLRSEFQALLSVTRSASAESTGVVFPRPLEMSSTELAFIMDYVDGVPLDEHSGRMTRGVRARLSRTILEGLRRYYTETGTLYGDFQPGNVLVRDGSLGFLDPTMPNPLFERTAAALSLAPLSADIGYWLSAVTVRVRWMGLHPLRGYRLLGLTVRLMRDAASGLAPDRRSLFVLETRSAAAVYLRPLLQKRRRNRIQHRIASFLQWVATSLAARLPRRYPTLA